MMRRGAAGLSDGEFREVSDYLVSTAGLVFDESRRPVHTEELLWAVSGRADPVDVLEPHRVLYVSDVQVRDLDDGRQCLPSVLATAVCDGQVLTQVHGPRRGCPKTPITRPWPAGDGRFQRRSSQKVHLRAYAPVEENGGRPEYDGSSCCSGLQQPPTRQRDHD